MTNIEILTDKIAERLSEKIKMPKELLIDKAYEIVYFWSDEQKKSYMDLINKYKD